MSNVSVFPTPLPERDRPADGLAVSHLIAPHGGELVNPMADARARRRAQGRLPRLALLGSHAAPVLRPRAAAQRRLLAPDRLHGAGRPRLRLRAHAPRRRHPVADPHHCSTSPRRAGREAARRRHAGAARPRGGDARRPARRGDVGARPRGERPGDLRHHQRRPPGRRPPAPQDQQRRPGRPDRGDAAPRPLRLPRPAPDAGRAAGRVRPRGAGAASSPSRPATPCTAPTAS